MNVSQSRYTAEIEPPPIPAQTQITKVKNGVLWLASVVNLVGFGSDQYQSTNLRQDVNTALDLEDIRISIDSSDEFHLIWFNSLVDKTFKMRYYSKLHKEIEDAEHDIKRRRVIKRKNSTDDLFQSLVGAFFLSTTKAKAEGMGIKGLYSERTNIVGRQSINRILKQLNYKRS